MHKSMCILVAVAIAAVVIILAMWLSKSSKKTSTGCNCSAQNDEIYFIGYADGVNGTEEEEDTKETFYDYEYSEGGKKYQNKTGSKFVKAVGGQCPPHTKVVTYGSHKGKCQRQYSWYDTYRGTDKSGKLFTCTGGRVAKDGYCICDQSSGKVWDGTRCMCDKSKGMKFDKKTGRCRDIKSGQSYQSKVAKLVQKKKSCPRFQKWNGKSCVCDTSKGVTWNGKDCVCDEANGWKWDGNKGVCYK